MDIAASQKGAKSELGSMRAFHLAEAIINKCHFISHEVCLPLVDGWWGSGYFLGERSCWISLTLRFR